MFYMWSMLTIIKPALMSTSFPTQGHHIVFMCPDVIIQTLPLCSRLMTSHHVTCHVTAVSCASSSFKRKRKEKENSYKIRKNKRKEKSKFFMSKVSYNNLVANKVYYHHFFLSYHHLIW